MSADTTTLSPKNQEILNFARSVMDPETYANLLTVMQMAQQGDPHAQEMMITVMGSLVQKKRPNTAALADLAKNGKNKIEITGTVGDSIKPT